MPDITAKIRAKGCADTGVTEAIAQQLYASKGRRMMAIVELRSVERHEKADGERRVDVVLTQVEPATDDLLAEHLRELTRTMYFNRQLAEGTQPTLDGDGIEPKVADVLAAGRAHRPHPYMASTLSTEDEPVCDICGLVEGAAQHLAGLEDVPTDEDGEEELAEEDEPHAFVENVDGNCRICAREEHELPHVDADEPTDSEPLDDLPETAYPDDAVDLEPADEDGPCGAKNYGGTGPITCTQPAGAAHDTYPNGDLHHSALNAAGALTHWTTKPNGSSNVVAFSSAK